jgi:hypothetical protein
MGPHRVNKWANYQLIDNDDDAPDGDHAIIRV